MKKIHALTSREPNSEAFNLPLRLYRRQLRAVGLDVALFFEAKERLYECDLLLLNSKYFRPVQRQVDVIVAFVTAAKERVGRVHWFDTTDSTSLMQTPVLSFVDRYFKRQLLGDRSRYKEAWYGGRIYTDYYHRHHGVEDEEPLHSKPVVSDEDLGKLGVSWSAAIANYSHSKVRPLLHRVQRTLGLPPWRSLPRRWVAPSLDRTIGVSARFGVAHRRATIRYQRERMRALLNGKAPLEWLDSGAYFQEMEHSKMVLAPFGWGEFNYRDYEAFLSGSLLVKPDVSHMETWPDLYQDGITCLSHDWDLSSLVETIDHVCGNYEKYLGIAVQGQNNYREHLVGETAGERFAQRVVSMLE